LRVHINGIAPGPQIFETHTFGLYIFGALLEANLIMLILEYFGINVFVKILKIPQHILMPFIMVLCCVGAYSVSNNIFDVYTLLGFGLLD
jgi:putative tricarboxylic transport membrane protein